MLEAAAASVTLTREGVFCKTALETGPGPRILEDTSSLLVYLVIFQSKPKQPTYQQINQRWAISQGVWW